MADGSDFGAAARGEAVKLRFDVNAVSSTEFGIGRDVDSGNVFTVAPVDEDIQYALQDMAVATQEAMADFEAPVRYEPAEKYGNTEYVILPIGDSLAEPIRHLHEAVNLPIDVNALKDPSSVFCYFARYSDKQKHHLTALRRATQFKGILKSRLIRLTTDALRLVDDTIFKLDTNFDLLVDSSYVHILRPSGFEFLAELKGAVLAAVPRNIAALETDLPYVDFASIQNYAMKHSRAARSLASLRVQGEVANVDKIALRRICKEMGVDIGDSKGKINVPEGSVIGFLEVLDRRRYAVELVKDAPERFRAGSRQKLK